MMLDKVGDVAQDVQVQLDERVKQFSRWMKPYANRVGKLSGDFRPYAEQALEVARKHPGKTVAGALAFGYLLARLTRR